MTQTLSNRVHLALVEALGDPGALEGLQLGWLAAPAWTEAIDRVRTTRFPDLSREQAFLEVGRYLGMRFIASTEGALVRESLHTQSPAGLFGRLFPLMGVRLRQSLTVDWAASPVGGSLLIGGARATPPEVTLGFIDALAAAMSPAPRVRLGRTEPELLELLVEW